MGDGSNAGAAKTGTAISMGKDVIVLGRPASHRWTALAVDS